MSFPTINKAVLATVVGGRTFHVPPPAISPEQAQGTQQAAEQAKQAGQQQQQQQMQMVHDLSQIKDIRDPGERKHALMQVAMQNMQGMG